MKTIILKEIIKNNRVIIKNFSFLTILQLFLLLSPLITFPYLIRVLGKDCYGVIITAQVIVSYFSLIIEFGTNGVCAKYVSINRDNKEVLSEIVCSILSLKFILFLISFFVYSVIVFVVPNYHSHWCLFLLMYSLTFNELLFPQYYFQGMERMGIITTLNIVFKLVFIFLIFVFIKDGDDYILMPIFYGLGHLFVGLTSLCIIFKKDKLCFHIPNPDIILKYVKEAGVIFTTDIITTIKDKLNYLLIGRYVSMGDVVVYDLSIKINGFIVRPVNILATVLFPRFAKERNVHKLRKSIILSLLSVLCLVLFVNIFMEQISYFFLHEKVDTIPLRLFSLAPVFLSISYMIGYNYLLAFGHNKVLLNSIIVTTGVYLIALAALFVLNIENNLYSFIYVAIISYLSELIYRMYKTIKLIKTNEK